ncbi:phage BR0599 family protein [Acinetobacter sp. YH12071]|uniref:phage BR0599 family protein n=1 Tax=Acinetobacter sp. YH12071 TaxID=2601067 RepID=UPI0015D105BE|nr:phage BR0599 family protein [Acinetobacter sp. YH12071]
MARAELYQFTHGSKQWFFTSARKAVTHNENTYYPVRGLSRGNIEDADIDKCEVELTFPHPYPLFNDADDSFTQVFLNKIYLESVHFTLIELDGADSLVLFKGRVTQPKFDDHNNTMTLVCSTAESFMRRNILTRKFQRTCPNNIYDKFCGLDFNEWSFEVTVTAIDGLNVAYTVNPTQVVDESGNPVFEQVPVLDEFGQPVLDGEGQPMYTDGDPIMEVKSYPARWLNRGVLKKDGVFTFIVGNGSNGSARLYRQHIGLEVGDVVLLTPGCDQSHKTCHEKFNNHKRFGGHPNMPTENPLETQLIK